MNSRFTNITRTVWGLTLLCFLISCQDTMPRRSTISPGSIYDDIPVCTEDQVLVEVPDESATTGGTTTSGTTTSGATGDDETPIDPSKTYVCQDKVAVRPDNAVNWKSGFCACKDSKPVSYGNCTAFCADKATNGAETLYASFAVKEAILLSGLGNLTAWCTLNLPGDTVNPSCVIEAKDDTGAITRIDVINPPNSNSITANIKDKLADNKTYVLTLVETTSGAKSDSVQIIKFPADTTLPILGPLKNAPISQYTCLVRALSEDTNTGTIYYESAYRLHFYFIPRLPPDPIPAGNSNLICHDIFNPLYGLIDNVLNPRLEQTPGVFNLWDTTDPRFYDNNGNGAIDINEAIVQKTRNFGGTIAADAKFFTPFSWPGAPELESDAGNTTTTQPLGYFMAPWIDQTTFKSYCLTSTHYNSSNALFKAMKDYIGVDTEGLYVGEKAPESVINSDGVATSGFADYILIRETDLKAVWFYLNAGVPTVPTDNNVSNNAVYFYYPLNKASPFVRTSTQRVFQVKGARELSDQAAGSTTSTGGTTSFPPHDRKIGCVPKF